MEVQARELFALAVASVGSVASTTVKALRRYERGLRLVRPELVLDQFSAEGFPLIVGDRTATTWRSVAETLL